jgi:diacylglycerol kinase (ATP)
MPWGVTIAVVAHSRKQLGGGLAELRTVLADRGVTDPLWFEVTKSKRAPEAVEKALGHDVEVLFVWGGDGMVQRSIDAAVSAAGAGGAPPIAILPAGTANLLATNLRIPKDITAAVEIGLSGPRRPIDLGVVNGEHFAVMAGTGFDAMMIRDADAGLKDRIGRAAYIVTGARHLGGACTPVRIKVDGVKWFDGDASCVLFGNVGRLFGGITAFADARPDDGRLELGVVTAEGTLQWMRTLARTATGHGDKSKYVETTSGHRFDVKLAEKRPYELDGGDRKPRRRLRVETSPGAVTICVPELDADARRDKERSE